MLNTYKVSNIWEIKEYIQKIREIAKKIRKHKEILMGPNEYFNFVINNGEFILYENGREIYRKSFDLNILKQQIKEISYVKPLYLNEDFYHSPLEADKFKKNWLYVNDKTNLNFPKFIPILFFYIYYTGKIPDPITFAITYINVYMEIVPENEIKQNLSSFYTDEYDKYEMLGKKIEYSNGFTIINKAIRYKKEYCPKLNIAINQMTMDQVIVRAIKVFGSIVRDFYNPIIFHYYGANAYYSYYEDLHGVDMLLNDIPCYSYTNTKAAKEFAKDKTAIRHPNLRTDCGIRLKADITKLTEDSGLHVIIEEIIKDVIAITKKQDIGLVDVFY